MYCVDGFQSLIAAVLPYKLYSVSIHGFSVGDGLDRGIHFMVLIDRCGKRRFQRFAETKRELSSKSPNVDSPHPRKAKNIRINNV